MIFSKPFYYIRNIKDHLKYKERILSRMNENSFWIHTPQITEYRSVISNTDWSFTTSDWFEKFFSQRDKDQLERYICQKYGVNGIDVRRQWFNQYYKNSGSDHPYHNHSSEKNFNDLTCIYYVELENKSLRTILKNPRTGKEVIPRAKEGQILIFDATILHKSPRNYTDTRKSVISFNIRLCR